MEIKKDRRVVISGRSICLVVGILSAVCGLYCLVKALFCDETNLPALLSNIVIALFLTLYAGKR